VSSKIDVVFLDLDGVMVALHERIGEIFQAPPETWPLGVFEFSKIFGRTAKEVWEHPEVRGEAFWRDLPALPWADDVYRMCRAAAGEVVFLTGTVLDPGSAAGKQGWIRRRYPQAHFLLGPSKTKELVARPRACLVDDSDENVDAWTAAWGTGILFPRRWNSGHPHCADPPAHLERMLRRATEGQ